MAAVQILTAKCEGVGMKLCTIIIITLGIVLLIVSLLMPIRYGCKLNKLCEQEPAEWKQSEIEKVE